MDKNKKEQLKSLCTKVHDDYEMADGCWFRIGAHTPHEEEISLLGKYRFYLARADRLHRRLKRIGISC